MRIKLYRSVILQETCLKSYPAIDISLEENTSEVRKEIGHLSGLKRIGLYINIPNVSLLRSTPLKENAFF